MCAGCPCIAILIVTASLRQQLGERGRVFAMALVVLQRLFHERELDASELMQQLSRRDVPEGYPAKANSAI